MAAQPATADWEWNYYHDYSVRVKILPPVYATKSRRLSHSLKEMLQSCTEVHIESLRTTERALSPNKKHCYAFISVSSEDDGNKFIADMSMTALDGLKLKAEWSSSSDPIMPKQPHTIERDGVPGVARWHPKVGPLTDMGGWQGPAGQPSPQAQDQDPMGKEVAPHLTSTVPLSEWAWTLRRRGRHNRHVHKRRHSNKWDLPLHALPTKKLTPPHRLRGMDS
jgi:hypothetical protein